MTLFKKIITTITLIATVLLTSMVMADGAGFSHFPRPKDAFAGFYVEGNVAYIYTNWLNYGPTSPTFHFIRKQRYGFNIGLDGGYRFNDYIALEAGWYKLITSKARRFTPRIQTLFRSWIGYGAVKLMAPVSEHVFIFTKLGAVRRSVTVTSAITQGIDACYWAPLFSVGFQYNVSETVTLGLQYLHVPGYQDTVSPGTDRFNTPASELLMVTLGYSFL